MNSPQPYHRRVALRAAALVCLGVFVTCGFAQTAGPSASDKVVKLEAFRVNATIETYHQSTSSMATKLPMDVRQLASSLSILNAAAINDRNAVALTDVFNYVVGATQSQANINGFSFRGFPNTGAYTQNIQFDGLMGATLKKAATSAADVDRLEFLKGPNSVLYGQMNPGGLLNIVTKNPKEIPETNLRFTAGTYAGAFNDPGSKNTISSSLDNTGPLGGGGHLFYRLVIDAESNPSSRPGFDHLYSFYPSLTYKWSNATHLTLKAEVSKDTRRQDDGLVPIFTNGTAFGPDARFVTAPLDTIYNDSMDRGLDYGDALSAFFHTTLGPDWTLRVQTRSVWHIDQVREFTINNANIYNPKAKYATPASTLRRQYNNVRNGHRYNYADANAFRAFGSGSVRHTLLLGVGGGGEAFLNRRISFGPNQPAAQAITLYHPVLDRAASYPADGTGATDVATYWTSLGEYVSDQIKIGEHVHLSAGLRHDAIRIHGANKLKLATTKFSNKYSTFTKQFGLVGDVTPRLSLYASWSQSLKPGSNLAYDASGNSSFPPESGEQYEAGLKFEAPKKNLNATVAFYQIKRQNVIVPTGTNFTVPTGNAIVGQAISRLDGEQRSRGTEWEVQWQPVPYWQLQAGLAYCVAQITQSQKNPASVGQDLANAPRVSGNLWTRYNIPTGRLKGLGFGAGLLHVGEQWAGSPTTSVYYKLPAWTRLDAAVYYRWKQYAFALNVQNVFDRRYISSSQSALTLNVGEQRKIALSISRRY